MERVKISVERAIEILDPEHREHYDDLPDGMEQVNEACRMGREALLAIKEAGASAERVRQLVQAANEGRITVKPPATGAVCGTCGNFCRKVGTMRGTCKVKPYKRDRRGQVYEGKQYVVTQSHIACKEYKRV